MCCMHALGTNGLIAFRYVYIALRRSKRKSITAYRSHCHGNKHVNSAPKFNRPQAEFTAGSKIYRYTYRNCLRVHLNPTDVRVQFTCERVCTSVKVLNTALLPYTYGTLIWQTATHWQNALVLVGVQAL